MRNLCVYKRVFSFLQSSRSCYFVLGKPQRQVNLLCRLSKQNLRFHGSVTSSKVCETDEKSSFRNLLLSRIQQAHRSVVVEIPSQKALFEVSKFLEDLSGTKEISHFTSKKSQREFLIAEFQDADAVQSFLGRCKSVCQLNEIPTFCRILKYADTSQDGISKGSFEANGSRTHPATFKNCEMDSKIFRNVSEVLENSYEEEKLTEIETKIRFFICSQISDAFRGLFSHCEVLPFGSTINGLGTHNSDLDTVLILYGKKEIKDSGLYFQTKEPLDADYEEKILKTVSSVLNTFAAGVVNVEPVYKARVPLVKFHHELFEVDCDLSTSNISGLEMSELLYNCGLLDSRVRPLAFAVRKWAKMSRITTDIGTHTVSNFALSQLLIFFLQTRPQPILPPLRHLTEAKSNEETTMNNLKYGTSNEETLGDLFGEFLCFLKSFSFRSNAVSTYYGKVMRKQENSPLVIENPLDRKLNISLNVNKNSLRDLRQAATLSVDYLKVFFRCPEINDVNFWKTMSAQYCAEIEDEK